MIFCFKNLMKKIFNILLGLTFSCLVLANPMDSTNVVTSEDVEQWLQEYAGGEVSVTDTLVVSVDKKDTIAPKEIPLMVSQPLAIIIPIPEAVEMVEDSVLENALPTTDSPKNTLVNWLDKIPLKPSDFITKEDSIEMRRDALKKMRSNPLFIDEWVFSTARKTTDTPQTTEEIITYLRQEARAELFKQNPDVYVYHESQLPNIQEIINKRLAAASNEKIQVNQTELKNIDQIKTFKLAVSPWVHNAELQAQFSQNYISDNWYTGGESNLTTYFFLKGNLNYNNNKNLQWDNQLNAKFSFNTAGSDTLRLFRTNDDLVKLTSKLGMRIANTKRFYYTAEGEFSTPLFNTYVVNSYQRVAGPFSPIRFYLSVGVDYKRDNLSVFVSPLSYKLIYVSDTTVRQGVTVSIADKVGIDAGRNIKNELGSKVKVKWEYEVSKEIKMETNFSLYTNYHGAEVDWEIIGNFIINRFMSARISFNPRFDSTITLPDDEIPRLQLKELISIGFRYKL